DVSRAGRRGARPRVRAAASSHRPRVVEGSRRVGRGAGVPRGRAGRGEALHRQAPVARGLSRRRLDAFYVRLTQPSRAAHAGGGSFTSFPTNGGQGLMNGKKTFGIALAVLSLALIAAGAGAAHGGGGFRAHFIFRGHLLATPPANATSISLEVEGGN